jgi:phosphoglycerol transferase
MIHENSSYIRLYEITTNFDSHLYQAKLEDGIDFRKSSYPEFLKYVSGISQREDWGRWTDANQGEHVLLGFNSPLPKRFALELEAIPFEKNVGKVTQIRVGDQIETIVVDGKSKTFRLDFENMRGSDVIKITAPSASIKIGKDAGADPRRIGVGLVHLKIKDLDKLP